MTNDTQADGVAPDDFDFDLVITTRDLQFLVGVIALHSVIRGAGLDSDLTHENLAQLRELFAIGEYSSDEADELAIQLVTSLGDSVKIEPTARGMTAIVRGHAGGKPPIC